MGRNNNFTPGNHLKSQGPGYPERVTFDPQSSETPRTDIGGLPSFRDKNNGSYKGIAYAVVPIPSVIGLVDRYGAVVEGQIVINPINGKGYSRPRAAAWNATKHIRQLLRKRKLERPTP